jgi:hypothetical protein
VASVSTPDNRILQASPVPGTGQVEKRLTTTGGLEDAAFHANILADRHQHWLPADTQFVICAP